MKLVGKIEDLGLGEILQIVSFSQKSGVLWLNSQKRTGALVFKSGLVIKASSNVRGEGVGEALVRSGNISEDMLSKAKSMQQSEGFTRSLGVIFAENFGVDASTIEENAKGVIEKTVYSFFRWTDGSFIFELKDYEDTPEELKSDNLQYTLSHGLNAQYIAMEGTRIQDESVRDGEAQAAAETAAQAGEGVESDNVLNAKFFAEMEEAGLIDKGVESEPVIEETKGIKLLKGMLEELSRPLSMSEIVLLILRFSTELMSRSVVFAVKQGNIVGLGQSGIELKDANPDMRVRKMKIPLDAPSVLREAIEKKTQIIKELEDTEWNGYMIKEFGGMEPLEVYVSPVVVNGKVALILYGDNLPGMAPIGDTSSLEIFLAQTRIALERLILERRVSGGGPGPLL